MKHYLHNIFFTVHSLIAEGHELIVASKASSNAWLNTLSIVRATAVVVFLFTDRSLSWLLQHLFTYPGLTTFASQWGSQSFSWL